MLKILTYYAQCYAQEEELCLVCYNNLYTNYLNKSLLTADNLERLFY